jgi:hypothetical protein
MAIPSYVGSQIALIDIFPEKLPIVAFALLG